MWKAFGRLFESNVSRIDRLFEHEFDRAKERLERLYEHASDVNARYHWLVVTACVAGGCASAQSALRGDNQLSEAWGLGNQAGARGVAVISSLKTVSPWLRYWYDRGESEQTKRKETRRFLCGCVYGVFDQEPLPDEVDRFIALDDQYNYDESHHHPYTSTWRLLYYHELLEACGLPPQFNWEDLKTPYESSRDAPKPRFGWDNWLTEDYLLAASIGFGLSHSVGSFYNARGLTLSPDMRMTDAIAQLAQEGEWGTPSPSSKRRRSPRSRHLRQ